MKSNTFEFIADITDNKVESFLKDSILIYELKPYLTDDLNILHKGVLEKRIKTRKALYEEFMGKLDDYIISLVKQMLNKEQKIICVHEIKDKYVAVYWFFSNSPKSMKVKFPLHSKNWKNDYKKRIDSKYPTALFKNVRIDHTTN